MLKRIMLSAIALLVFEAAPASAQVSLQWKFKEGEKFFLEIKTANKMKTKVMGQEIEQAQDMTQLMEMSVKKVAPGAIVLEAKVDSMKSKTEMLGNAVDASEDLDAMFKGVVYTVTITPDGKITKFEGYEQVLKNLDNLLGKTDDPGKKLGYTMVKQMMTEEAIKVSYASIFDVLPPGAIKVGEHWKREENMPMGPMGSFKLDVDYTYKGPADANLQKIEFKAKATHEAPKADAGGALFTIKKVDFSKSKIDGELLFDKKANRISQYQRNANLAGQMTIEAGGMELTVELDGSVISTTRILEKRPVVD